jgi:hypothetical protein
MLCMFIGGSQCNFCQLDDSRSLCQLLEARVVYYCGNRYRYGRLRAQVPGRYHLLGSTPGASSRVQAYRRLHKENGRASFFQSDVCNSRCARGRHSLDTITGLYRQLGLLKISTVCMNVPLTNQGLSTLQFILRNTHRNNAKEKAYHLIGAWIVQSSP